jgi:hypothetical protein
MGVPPSAEMRVSHIQLNAKHYRAAHTAIVARTALD